MWKYKEDIMRVLWEVLRPQIDRGIELRVIFVQGQQGVGKTVFMNWLASEYLKNVPNLDIISASRQRHIQFNPQAFEHLVVFDDAITEGLNSRRSMSRQNVVDSSRFFKTRHRCASTGQKSAHINLFYLTQRAQMLDVNVRTATHVIVIKSMLPEELEVNKGWIPELAQQKIREITAGVFRGKQSIRDKAKSLSVILIPAYAEWGIIRSNYVDPILPAVPEDENQDYTLLFEEMDQIGLPKDKGIVKTWLQCECNYEFDEDELPEIVERYRLFLALKKR